MTCEDFNDSFRLLCSFAPKIPLYPQRHHNERTHISHNTVHLSKFDRQERMVSDSQRQRPRNPLVKHARNGSGKSIPHKRGAGGGGANNRKPKTTQKLSFHSTTCDSNNNSNKSGDLFSEFPKLDPSIPEQKRRLEQRRKMISYGKNTVGYDEYIKQVPKEKRRKRNMETPATPDHTLDIPNKRWMGQVRAW